MIYMMYIIQIRVTCRKNWRESCVIDRVYIIKFLIFECSHLPYSSNNLNMVGLAKSVRGDRIRKQIFIFLLTCFMGFAGIAIP